MIAAFKFLVRRIMLTQAFLILVFAIVSFGAGYRVFFWPPSQIVDACALMTDRPGWWRAVRASQERWSVAPATQLAVIKRESSFRRFVHPPRFPPVFVRSVRSGYRRIDRAFGWSLNDSFTWPTLYTAFGYPQAIDATWELYKTNLNRTVALRVRFADAADFVGWYLSYLRSRDRIAAGDVCTLYVAYYLGSAQRVRCDVEEHADHTAVRKGRVVAEYAEAYAHQLNECASQLDADSRWWAWPLAKIRLPNGAN